MPGSGRHYNLKLATDLGFLEATCHYLDPRNSGQRVALGELIERGIIVMVQPVVAAEESKVGLIGFENLSPQLGKLIDIH